MLLVMQPSYSYLQSGLVRIQFPLELGGCARGQQTTEAYLSSENPVGSPLTIQWTKLSWSDSPTLSFKRQIRKET